MKAELYKPLVVMRQDKGDEGVYPIGRPRGDNCTWDIVADVFSCGGTEGECAEMATLMAAAPQMLTALEAVQTWVCGDRSRDITAIPMDVWTKVLKAIMAAKGGEL